MRRRIPVRKKTAETFLAARRRVSMFLVNESIYRYFVVILRPNLLLDGCLRGVWPCAAKPDP